MICTHGRRRGPMTESSPAVGQTADDERTYWNAPSSELPREFRYGYAPALSTWMVLLLLLVAGSSADVARVVGEWEGGGWMVAGTWTRTRSFCMAPSWVPSAIECARSREFPIGKRHLLSPLLRISIHGTSGAFYLPFAFLALLS
ncbi:hypothetical protein DL93DRAFT_989080 [Clavulina sp. PMI_390]|nr:hypothetical protein DL93DRAFT_989080 [Clavulina sp. PMI_390]